MTRSRGIRRAGAPCTAFSCTSGQWLLWLSLERGADGYSLDLALPSSRIAIEVDGPFHFLQPDDRGVRKSNGPTLLKRRLLAAAGWRVISVPFYEWDGLTINEQQAYLEKAVALPLVV